MPEPIPDVEYGRASWVDYVNYWRAADAAWIEDRAILRFATTGDRNTALASPGAGQLTYISATDTYEWRSTAAGGSWKSFRPLPANAVITQDDGTAIGLTHSASAGKGVFIANAAVSINNNLNVLTNVLAVSASGVAVKTGTKTALLSTTATNLVSDSPLTVPAVSATGAVTAASATITTITSTTENTGTLNVTGTVAANIVNAAASANLGGVLMSGNVATASLGYVSGAGYFYGDSTTAIMRERNTSTGALGNAYIQIGITDVVLAGGNVRAYGQLIIQAGNSVQFQNVGGSFIGYGAMVVVSGPDPGVANVPEGTIWIQP